MLIGVPRAIKDHEYRVGLTPDSVSEVVLHGHDVIVERGAGAGIGADDAEYATVGAEIVDGAEAVFERAEMIVKVKEPLTGERAMLRGGQVLFTCLHLAPDPEQTEDLVKSKAVCIAYETVTSPAGGLPLLAPMSEVAGRLSIQAAANALNNATLPHVLTLANKGYRQALTDDPHLRNGLNVHAGEVTCREVADALGYPYRAPMSAMAA